MDSTSSTQKPLFVLLDEIEEQNRLGAKQLETIPYVGPYPQPLCRAMSNNAALVKALRRADEALAIIEKVSNTNRENHWAREARVDMAALLNQGRTTQDLGEQ